MDEAMLVLRGVVGWVMFFHGTEKLFGWWGGEGIDGAADFFGRQGFRPPRLMAIVAGTTETAAGCLLAVGLLSPLACLMLIGTLVNVVALHLRNGLSRKRNGYEYELVLLAAAVAVLLAGPGVWSVDEAVGVPALDPLIKAGILALGIVSGLAVVASRKKPALAGGVR